VTRVWLTGQLSPWVTAKDVILELLRRLTVRGGTGKIFEYGGPGLASLIAAQRMTIANMGAELGLTTSVFPSDDVTRSFLTPPGRGEEWRPRLPAGDVVAVSEVAGTAVEQVMVGSCTNGSWHDMASVHGVLAGQRVHGSVSFVLFPGSHRILETMARGGLLAGLLAAGALVSEPSCGSCAGIGHVPA